MNWLEPVLGDTRLVVSTVQALRTRPEVERLLIDRHSDPFHSPVRDPAVVSFEMELAVDYAALARRLGEGRQPRVIRRGDEDVAEYGRYYLAATERGAKLWWFRDQPEWAMPPLDMAQVEHVLAVLFDRMVTDSDDAEMRATLASVVGSCGRVLPPRPMSDGWTWIVLELTPPIAIAAFARAFRLENLGLTPADAHHTQWYVMARGADQRYHTKPEYGRWTLRAVLEDRPEGENGASLVMMKHEGLFPLYPAEGCVTRIKTLNICPPSQPLRVIR